MAVLRDRRQILGNQLGKPMPGFNTRGEPPDPSMMFNNYTGPGTGPSNGGVPVRGGGTGQTMTGATSSQQPVNPASATTLAQAGFNLDDPLANAPMFAEFELSPSQQRLFDLQNATREMGLLRGMQGLEGMEGLQTSFGPTDFEGATQSASDAVFDQFSRRMDPVFGNQQEQLQQQLADQGIPIGSEQFEERMRMMSQQQNDARLNAMDQARMAGSQEQQRLFGQAQAQAGFGNQAQMADFQRMQSLLGQSGPQQTGLNDFFSPGGVDPMGALGMQQQADMAGFNADVANQQGKLGAAGNLGSAALMAAMMSSSKAFKEDRGPVEGILEKLKKLEIRRWRYHWDDEDVEHIGPYAEDFRDVFGVGDGVHIEIVDMLGVLTGAVKELSERVEAHGGY